MRVTVVSASDIPTDPRVMRQIRLFQNNGICVYAVGFGSDSLGGILETHELPPPSWRRRLTTGLRLTISRLTTADFVYWANKTHRNMLASVIKSRPHIIHANDWESLPIAVAAMRHIGCRTIYDAHEYAVGQR